MKTPSQSSAVLEKVRELRREEKWASKIGWFIADAMRDRGGIGEEDQRISHKGVSMSPKNKKARERTYNPCCGDGHWILKYGDKELSGMEGKDALFICKLRNHFPQIAQLCETLHKENQKKDEQLEKCKNVFEIIKSPLTSERVLRDHATKALSNIFPEDK